MYYTLLTAYDASNTAVSGGMYTSSVRIASLIYILEFENNVQCTNTAIHLYIYIPLHMESKFVCVHMYMHVHGNNINIFA